MFLHLKYNIINFNILLNIKYKYFIIIKYQHENKLQNKVNAIA